MSVILRKYATTSTVNFPLIAFGLTNFTSTASLTTADMKLSLNEGVFTTVGTAIVNEGSFGYSYTMTTADLTAARVMMVVVHTAATKTFEDTMLLIETYGNTAAQHTFDFSVANQTVIASAGTVTLAASALSAGALVAGAFSAGAFAAGFLSAGGIAASAISLGGIATGAIDSTKFVAGAIDSISLNATAVNKIWNQALIQPTAVPAITAGALSGLSWMYALSLLRITQTSVLQSVYQTDGSTLIAAGTQSDDGTTYVHGSFN